MHGSAVTVGDPSHRAPFTENVRRAVDQYRAAQCPYRGDLQRLHCGADVRPPCLSTGAIRRTQCRGLPGKFRRTVLLRARLTRDGVRRQPQLCGCRGDRRLSGGHRPDHPGQRPGFHSVRSPVQSTSDPGGRHVQHVPVRGCQRRARIRLPRRTRGTGVRNSSVAERARSGRISRRLVRLFPRHAGDRGPVVGSRARQHGGDRRPDRRGQDNVGESADEVLRRRLRTDSARRRRHPGRQPRVTAIPDRDGASGWLAVRRDHRREHRLRQTRRDRG